MSHSRRLAVSVGLGIATAAAPSVTLAHALGDATYRLPVPLWLYLAGAAVAVAGSFVVTSLLADRTEAAPRYAPALAGPGLTAGARVVLRNVGMFWWYGAIAIGFAIGDISPLPAVLLWIGIWVALPMAAALVGNAWPSLSPFRTSFAGLEWIARRLGAGRLDLGLRYPAALSRWPAVVLLLAGVWAELVLPGSAAASTVAVLMTAYTLFTLAGMIAFGQVAWLRHAELFEVELGWFGRIGAIARRSVSETLCAQCAEGCSIERCIDCPECSTAADDAERRAGWRAPIIGITDVARGDWSDAAFIVLLLAGITFDGMRETPFGAAVLQWLLPPVTGWLGLTLPAFLLVDTLAMLMLAAAFGLAFAVVTWLTRRLGRIPHLRPGVYAATLLPIAAGYLVAHYLTLVIQGAIWLPALVRDPLLSLAPDMSWVPIAGVWYLSVAAIVGGHVAGITLAHRATLIDATGSATRAGLPMLVLMIGYTVLSLWIIAQPMVVDPNAVR